MLDMGFLPAIKRIVNRVPKERQTLLFSATFEARIKALAMEFMRNPQQVQVAANNTIVETITHRAHPVDDSRKRDLLIEILSSRHTDHVLVLGKTTHGCKRPAEQLYRQSVGADQIGAVRAVRGGRRRHRKKKTI